MAHALYVYPNVSGISQRGGLLERWRLARKLGCDYIEVPADFVKNKTEIEKTGLNLGDFLSEEAVARLYEKDCNLPQNLKYVLHTEPSLIRHDGYGMSYQAPLKWYDEEWRRQFVNMTVFIFEFLGSPATAIEIHLGDKRNSFEDIVTSIRLLLDRYSEEFKVEPLILIENRTRQCISSGEEILCFWNFLNEEYPHLKDKVGIVLDIQQLYTVTKKSFIPELDVIPLDALKGFHIHYKHRVPSSSNVIPWKHALAKIAKAKKDIMINPEVHHKNEVKATKEFCEEMLHQ